MIKDNSAQDNAVQQQYIHQTSTNVSKQAIILLKRPGQRKGGEIILDVFKKLLFWSKEDKINISFT